jgi:hypothetical protein
MRGFSGPNADENETISTSPVATARIARRFGFEDDETQRAAIRMIIKGLAEVARRTGGILPVEEVFTGIGDDFDPVRLVALRKDLHQTTSWVEVTACIRQIQQAVGHHIVTDGPGHTSRCSASIQR